MSRTSSSRSVKDASDAQGNLSPGTHSRISLTLSRPASGRPSMPRIGSVASISEENVDQALPEPSLSQATHDQAARAPEADATAAKPPVTSSAFSAFERPDALSVRSAGGEGSQDAGRSRIAALRRKQEDKCCR
jgi:hypothetical protein